jgi:hypothetical protein
MLTWGRQFDESTDLIVELAVELLFCVSVDSSIEVFGEESVSNESKRCIC